MFVSFVWVRLHSTIARSCDDGLRKQTGLERLVSQQSERHGYFVLYSIPSNTIWRVGLSRLRTQLNICIQVAAN